ncbi:FAD-binding oxidoreductase [Sinomonas notoginsengisoli]|uniref:FAD-binding oxidoreductase n=1 Tax=Sinomonas notoginsengisoli TaxID=1457311 RepID=UPI001F1C5EAC|nr:FAD-binding oxidoreductase [Sinomonas notoginsengisoli]
MAEIQSVDTKEISALREVLRGQMLVAGDPEYDEARRVWNGAIDRRPALIVRCANVADVQQAVAFATRHGLPIAVRGGGHSVAGFSTCDAGVVIDLGLMRSVFVDADARVARAQAGATGADFDRATQQHGLATTLGVVSTTGIAGLTLGGGIGWLMRKHGLACDNLLSAELVTADGCLATASATENPELFWALKGGGGNFGIITSFEYQLHPVGPMVYGGSVAFAREHRRAVLESYRELARKAPDELTAYAAMTSAPDGSPVAAIAACYAGDPADGARLLDPTKAAVGEPLLDNLGPLTYSERQSRMDASYPPGEYHYWRSCFLDDLTDEVIDILIERASNIQAPPVLELIVEQLGGAIAAGDGAFAHRDANFDVLIAANWTNPADHDRCVAWARDTAAALGPYSRGGYANYEPDAEGAYVSGAYGDRLARLGAVKAQHDPTNVFRLNQNIPPS